MRLNFWPFKRNGQVRHMPATMWFYELQGAEHTKTPLMVYQDKECSIPHPWPVVADNEGKFPMMYLDGHPAYIEVKDADGLTLQALTEHP